MNSYVDDLFDNGDDVPAKNYTTTARSPESSREIPAKDVRAAVDAARPAAVRGRYTLPHPVTGKKTSWGRVTNFVGLYADTYHLERWHERNVAKGMAMLSAVPGASIGRVATMHVKGNKGELDNIVKRAKEAAGGNEAAKRGTDLHKSSEDADFAGSWQDAYSILKVTPGDRGKIQLYLDTLRANGLEVAYLDDGTPAIERVTVSQRYEVAGKLDRVMREADGSYVVVDVKTKDTLDFGVGEIAVQLAAYEDGINNTGIWDGRQYNRSLKVRTDYGLVIHLPQNGDTCTVEKIDLHMGRDLGEACLKVRDARRVKTDHGIRRYAPPAPLSQDERDAYWLEAANAAQTWGDLAAVAARAKSFGQFNERLSGQFRIIAEGLPL